MEDKIRYATIIQFEMMLSLPPVEDFCDKFFSLQRIPAVLVDLF